MRIFIVYYSKSGNTAKVAEILSEHLQAKGMEVETCSIKLKKDLGAFFGAFKAMKNKTTEIKECGNVEEHDFICIGTPVWAGSPHPGINEFIDKYVPSGITGAIFCSLGSSNDKKCLQKMRDRLSSKNSQIVAEKGFNMKQLKNDDEALSEEIAKLTEQISKSAQS